MIEIQGLTKQFGDFIAVDNLSFTVQPGEVLGFLGPNGAGKSTTMKMITGFLAPTAGRVSVFGHDISSEAMAAKTQIGYLPEGAPSYGDMTTSQFLNFIADIRGLKGRHKRIRIDEVVAQIQLQSVMQKPIDTLSKGYRRRVGLAQAILHDPRVLILDEPTDGLDPNQKHQVRELITNLSADKIVIVSTHILEEVSAVCSRAIIIANGRLVRDATPEGLESESRYYRAVSLQFTGGKAPADAIAQLRATSHVEEVEIDPATGQLTVFPSAGQEIFSGINQLIQKNNWSLQELHVDRGRLDDVFRSITGEKSSC